MQSAMIQNHSPPSYRHSYKGDLSVRNSMAGPLPFDSRDKDYKGLRGSKQKSYKFRQIMNNHHRDLLVA